MGVDRITYAGNHGLEILHPDGTRWAQVLKEEVALAENPWMYRVPLRLTSKWSINFVISIWTRSHCPWGNTLVTMHRNLCDAFTMHYIFCKYCNIYCFVDEGFPLSPKSARYGSQRDSLLHSLQQLSNIIPAFPLCIVCWLETFSKTPSNFKLLFTKTFHQIQPSYASRLQGKTCGIGEGAKGEVKSTNLEKYISGIS